MGMHNFVMGADVSEEGIHETVIGCSQNATERRSELDLDLKQRDVDAIVHNNDVTCEHGTEMAFWGSEWAVPMPGEGVLPRPPQLEQILPLPMPTFENLSLREYMKRPWTAIYSSVGDP